MVMHSHPNGLSIIVSLEWIKHRSDNSLELVFSVRGFGIFWQGGIG